MVKGNGRWLKLWLGILSIAVLFVGVHESTSVHLLPFSMPELMGKPGGDVERIQFFSPTLNAEMKVDVYLPPGYTSKVHYPVLYLLHGKGSTPNSWMSSPFLSLFSVDINKQATTLMLQKKIPPMILVAPEIDNSYGINTGGVKRSVNGYSRGDYETYLIQEVIPYIDEHYSTHPVASARYIGGYSMGGFAALHLAFIYPWMFSKVGTMSAALWVDGLPAELQWIYPTEAQQKLRDPLTYATQHKVSMAVYMVEGLSDPFYSANVALAHTLVAKHASIQFHTEPGGHNYSFWRSQATDLLMFFGGSTS
jgi:enterochelin esterase-like enzyme